MKKTLGWVLAALLILSLVRCNSQNAYKRNAIASAESYVTAQFYSDWGDSADKLESTVVYKGKEANGVPVHLIGVRCYWEGTVTGAYCVYTRYGAFRNATTILPSGYDFEENISSLKALFGIVG